MFFKVHFQADVNGLASVVRYDDTVFIEADNEKGARDKAESYIESAYSENFAIMEILRVPVV